MVRFNYNTFISKSINQSIISLVYIILIENKVVESEKSKLNKESIQGYSFVIHFSFKLLTICYMFCFYKTTHLLETSCL